MERHKERTIMCKCSCHSVVWQRAGTYKDWPVLLAIWDPETGRRGSGNIKGHCMWHPNQCTSTCRDFVIYSFVTFGGTFRREEETWARNRKSLHTAQKWCNFLLEGTDFGEEKKKKNHMKIMFDVDFSICWDTEDLKSTEWILKSIGRCHCMVKLVRLD